MANPTLTPFPTPPLPEQDEVTFNRNAANSLLAQANFVGEANTVVTWMGQQVDTVALAKKAAADSATAAGQAVTDAQAQVKLATDQAVASKASADAAAGSLASVKVVAQAVDAAAGLPPSDLPGGVLRQKLDGSGAKEWWVPVLSQVGDTVISTQAPDANWVPTGGIYAQSLFPSLFAKLGRIPDFRDDQMSTITLPNGAAAFNSYAGAAGNGAILFQGLNTSTNAYQFLYSLNAGASWNFVTYGNQTYAYPMAYGNGVIITGHSGQAGSVIFDTSTGNFTTGTLNQAGWFDGAFGNSTFVFITSNISIGNCARSTDNGKTFQYVQLPTDLTNPSAIRFINGLFVVFGSGNGVSVYYTSPDGANWTRRNLPGSGIIVQRQRIAVNNNSICIYDATGFYVSKDGINWQSSQLLSGMIISGAILSGGDNVFAIFIGGATSKIYFSVDGLKWASRDKVFTATTQALFPFSPPFMNGVFYFVGSQISYIWRVKAYSYNTAVQFYATDPVPSSASQIGLTQYIKGA